VLWTVEYLFVLVLLSWTLFAVMHGLAWLVGRVAVAEVARKSPGRDPAVRVARTASLSLTLPASLFFGLTPAVWRALGAGGVRSALLPPVNHRPAFPYLWPGIESAPATIFVKEWVTAGATPAFVPALVLIGLTSLLAVWSFFPVAWAEVHHPHTD